MRIMSTKESTAILRKSVPGKTYMVDGSDEDDAHYWYLFECEDVSDERLVGSDLADFEDQRYQSWHMEFNDMGNGGASSAGITSIREMTLDELRIERPEYFL